MEDLVLSIDQCKHLQKLGLYMNDAKLCWLREYAGRRFFVTPHSLLFEEDENCIRTYTLQEVLQKLPRRIRHNKKTYFLDISYLPKTDVIAYINRADLTDYLYFHRGNLMKIAYKLLCWVIEKGYLKVGRYQKREYHWDE